MMVPYIYCIIWEGSVWQARCGKVCDEEEEVKQVHLLPLQGERCRGFAPAGEDCLQTLPLQEAQVLLKNVDTNTVTSANSVRVG